MVQINKIPEWLYRPFTAYQIQCMEGLEYNFKSPQSHKVVLCNLSYFSRTGSTALRLYLHKSNPINKSKIKKHILFFKDVFSFPQTTLNIRAICVKFKALKPAWIFNCKFLPNNRLNLTCVASSISLFEEPSHGRLALNFNRMSITSS